MAKKSSPKQQSIPVVPQSPPLLVNIKGAAALLSSTVWAVRNLLWRKQIPYVRIGRRFLIDPADLREFIARQKGRAA